MDKDKIISLLKSKGPLVPNEIKKVLGGDTMILGAVLSELANRGFVRISYLKKGGSPFYFIPGQESQLERFTEFLNPKDQKTQELLKQEKVVQDHALELFYRVSLRQIKDFAKSFTIQTAQGDVLFWRYYLLSEQEARDFLRQKYAPKQAPQQQSSSSTTDAAQSPVASSTKQSAAPTTKTQSEAAPQTSTSQQQPTFEKKSNTTSSKSASTDSSSQQQLSTRPTLASSPFYDAVCDYFAQAEITVLEEKMITKDREYEFLIQVSSAVGRMDMFCLARNKKKLNQNDVAPALLKAKKHELPCFFLTNGAFTKKSKDIIKKEYKGVIIKSFSFD
jgi:hypothetical protein